MISYPNSTEVRVGDSVLLHHCAYTGIVQHIIDLPADLQQWNVKEPGLMINTPYGGLVFHPKDSLDQDEIVFVSRALD